MSEKKEKLDWKQDNSIRVFKELRIRFEEMKDLLEKEKERLEGEVSGKDNE